MDSAVAVQMRCSGSLLFRAFLDRGDHVGHGVEYSPAESLAGQFSEPIPVAVRRDVGRDRPRSHARRTCR